MATEQEFWGRSLECGAATMERDVTLHRMEQATVKPLDTSTLGPIKVDADADAARARMVRAAISSLSNEFGCGDLFCLLAQSGTDAALAKLGRLLR